jgi:hypothetical protein
MRMLARNLFRLRTPRGEIVVMDQDGRSLTVNRSGFLSLLTSAEENCPEKI